jgi:hypothetical protein
MGVTEELKAQLDTLELVYADLTDGRALVVAQEEGRYVFADGATARNLPDAVDQGRALVRFAINQMRQSA